MWYPLFYATLYINQMDRCYPEHHRHLFSGNYRQIHLEWFGKTNFFTSFFLFKKNSPASEQFQELSKLKDQFKSSHQFQSRQFKLYWEQLAFSGLWILHPSTGQASRMRRAPTIELEDQQFLTTEGFPPPVCSF